MAVNINWYPGHMKKTRELIADNIRAVDVVVEAIDSRIPVSSRNPIIDELCSERKRILVLGKSDLADVAETKKWVRYFEQQGNIAIAMNHKTGENVKEFNRIISELQHERNIGKSIKRAMRIMTVGVPNVGKSSFINRLAGKRSAKTGDKPGVTRGKQWITLENGVQMLDTPGILWHKFEDPKEGLHLALCGSIRDEVLSIQDLAYELLKILQKDYSGLLKERYKLTDVAGSEGEADDQFDEYGEFTDPAIVNIEAIARQRGFIMSGNRIDYERASRTIIDEFRSGMIGRITLERTKDDHSVVK